MTVDAEKAITYMRGLRNLIHGRCLMYVWRAYDHAGADTNRSAGSALEAWHKSEGKHPGDWNPPRGVPVWFGEPPYGDVVISLGGGRVIATDQPRYGVVGECTIAERERLAGGPYLGWTESIFDARVLPEPAPKRKPKPKVETEMRSLYNTDDNNEETRRATVGELTFHVLGPDASARERRVWGKPLNVSQEEWDGILALTNARRKMAGLTPLKGIRGEFPA